MAEKRLITVESGVLKRVDPADVALVSGVKTYGTTLTIDAENSSNTTIDIKNSGAGVANVTVDGDVTAANGHFGNKQKIEVKKGGTSVGIRTDLNLIEGSGIAITATDNAGQGRVDVTIAQTSISGSASLVKAGVVPKANFSGNPAKATVTFGTPFASTNYAVTLSQSANNHKKFALHYESKTVNGFVIDLGTGIGRCNDIIEVSWMAVEVAS